MFGGEMKSMKNVLLASHGTEGAQAAERMAFEFCEKGTLPSPRTRPEWILGLPGGLPPTCTISTSSSTIGVLPTPKKF